MKSAPQNDNTCAPPSELPAIVTSLRIIVSTAARRVGRRRRGAHELGLEVLRQREVEEGIERVDAELVGDLLHAAPEEPLVLGLCDRLHAEGVPREHEGAATRVGELGPHLLSQRGVAQSALAFGRRERQRVAEARHLVEQERRPEREVHALPIGREHRMQLEAVARGRLRELQTALPSVGRVGHRASTC